ncbi:hypothetical protein CS060_01525 [Anoxybacillus flavithermus]|uniref:DUF5668 domain-containing protein n=1 Tax=Anoxybacillus flavithermus TaxID=33934 RepID=A0A2G5RTQ9_9BACL|nr:hypothetical protein [Anoxybacillus flavithermus]KFZ42946.1 hypothetical protein JS80_06635 [Anoxybacillus sp. KU2-6(11)]PIC06228.1 hypothetical protein CS060_01525 [Anoxybacillus flavithermus]
MRQTVMAMFVLLLFFTLETFHIIQWYDASVWPLIVFSFGLIVHIYVFKRGVREHEVFLLLPAAIALWMGALAFGHYFSLNDGTMYVLAFTVGLFEWWLFSGEEWLKTPLLFCFGCSVAASLEAGNTFLLLFILTIGIGAYMHNEKNERANVH